MVDSFRTVVRKASVQRERNGAPGFRPAPGASPDQLAGHDVPDRRIRRGRAARQPGFTVADGLLWLYQSVERNSIVRKMQVMKLRGQESVPGLHTFRITDDGLQTFPRTFGLAGQSDHVKGRRRLSTGIRKLDALLGGGIPEGDSLLVAGPSGSGKSLLGTQFIAEGLRQGEPGIVAIFEEIPAEYAQRAAMFGFDFDTPQKDGTLKIIYLRPLDLSVDETVHEIVNSVKKIGCKRLVIDSLVGFEMALAPGFRTDFRESLYRMIAALTRLGVTILSTVEIEENFTSMDLSNFTVSFLADDILRLRYVSINGQLRKMLLVVKMRRSEHSIDMVEYQITSKGVVIGEPLRGYRGLTSGIPSRGHPSRRRFRNSGRRLKEIIPMNSTPTADSPVLPALESVLCTEELNRRPSRPPDYETGNRAWYRWPKRWPIRRASILQTLADTILECLPVRLGRRQPCDGRWNEVLLAGHRRRVDAAHRRRHAARLRPVRRRARSQLSPVVHGTSSGVIPTFSR